jgi:cell division septal protein FtsQ
MVVIAVSLAFVTIYQYMLTSAYIKLEEVVITGVDEEMRNRLLKMSQLRFDLSLLAVNTHDVKKRMEKHPWIRSVYIEKRFPHTLIIRAEREEPCGIVALDKLFYVSRYGEIFKEVNQDEDIDFPFITGLSNRGEDMKTTLILAIRVLDSLRSHSGGWTERDISEIHLDNDEDVSLYIRSIPGVIRLGIHNLDEKLDELNRVIEHLNKTGRTQMVRSIDLDCGGGVVVSFRST